MSRVRFLKYKLFRIVRPSAPNSFSLIFIFFYIYIIFSSISRTVTIVFFTIFSPLVFYNSTVFFIFDILFKVYFIHPIQIVLFRIQDYRAIWSNICPFFPRFFFLLFSIDNCQTISAEYIF